MKKIIDDPATFVRDSLAAFAEVHSGIVRADLEHRLCLRASPLPAGQVALVSGGGSGHEPLHAGFVGDGMLAAAVLGEIFTSPTPDQVLEAATAVQAGGGVLFIVKNYTGDVMNFGMAAEDAESDGVSVATVTVDEDAALPVGEGAGRRGTAASVCVEKIAGAAAASGAPLAEVTAIAERVVSESRSIGIALSACTTPAAGHPTFELGDDEVEFGVGIHGERGRRVQPLTSASELAEQLVDLLVLDLGLSAGDTVLAFTNGLGATPSGELYALHGAVLAALRRRGVASTRHLVGSYVTSLDMAGASISLLRLDDELTRWWDAPVSTPALTWG